MASYFAGTGSHPPEPVLSGILHALQSLREEQKSFHLSVNVRLSVIERHVGSRQHDDRILALAGDAPSREQSRSRSCSRRRDHPVLGLSWICPICGENFTHRESFKGHVRLCVLSQHQRCRLMEDNAQHQALLSRFPNCAWDDRAKAFTSEFYEQIRVCSTSQDSDIKSHQHIFGWLKAATSQDTTVPFPSYSAARVDAKRRRMETGSLSDGIVRNAAGVGGISSNDSSPELVNSQPFARRQ